MNEEEILIDSIEVSKIFNKNNKHINESIKNIIKKFPNLSNDYMVNTYISVRGRHENMYKMTKKGLKAIIDNSRKNSKIEDVIKLYNETFNEKLSSEIYLLKDRYEDEFYEMVTSIIPNLYIERQYYVGKYRVDFYIPTYNIILEYDEEQHDTETNKKRDKERMDYIKNIFKNNLKSYVKVIRIKKGKELDGIRLLLLNITNNQLFDKKEMIE